MSEDLKHQTPEDSEAFYLKDKPITEYEQSSDTQLDIFHHLNIKKKNKYEYFNLFELLDSLPRFLQTTKGLKRVENKYLDSFSKSFPLNGTHFELGVMPARLVDYKDNVEKDFLPGPTEEILELIIRKIASEPGRGKYFNGNYGVTFSIRELRDRLKEHGHTASHYQVIQSLTILRRTNYVLRPINADPKAKKPLLDSSMIIAIGFSDSENDNSETFVIFNDFASDSISNGEYRLSNYSALMGQKEPLPRWLLKRLTTHYKQASFTDPYDKLTYSGILRLSTMKPYGKIYQGVRKIEKALNSLKKAKPYPIISSFRTEYLYAKSPKNKIVDARFIIHPSIEFIKDAKLANKIQKIAKDTKYLSDN